MKEEILQVALKQFSKHGIREMSVQKLVELLGISTKTIYKYFKNKEELLEEVLLLSYAQQYQTIEKLSTDQNVVPLFMDIWYEAAQIKPKQSNRLFQDLHYYYPELEKKIETAIGKKFHQQFTHIIQKGIDEGVFLDTINPEVVMQGVYIFYNATARTEQFKQYAVSPYEVLLNTMFIYIRGLCTPNGIQEFEEHIQTFQPFGKSKKANEKVASDS
jgi:AcrR family transcriptional regulator